MNLVEIIGFVFGIAGIWLTIKEHWSCFPVGLVNVVFSLVLFLEQKLYSDTIQQAVYIVLLSYGWYKWQNRKYQIRPTISFLNFSDKVQLLVIGLIVAASMGLFFDFYTDAEVPYLDAVATSMSFIAQFLIARKKMENWIIWMAVNCLYIGIYTYKELYLYTFLFAIYLALAIQGYFSWKKMMNVKQNVPVNG